MEDLKLNKENNVVFFSENLNLKVISENSPKRKISKKVEEAILKFFSPKIEDASNIINELKNINKN